jgi:hypothetical protein
MGVRTRAISTEANPVPLTKMHINSGDDEENEDVEGENHAEGYPIMRQPHLI